MNSSALTRGPSAGFCRARSNTTDAPHFLLRITMSVSAATTMSNNDSSNGNVPAVTENDDLQQSALACRRHFFRLLCWPSPSVLLRPPAFLPARPPARLSLSLSVGHLVRPSVLQFPAFCVLRAAPPRNTLGLLRRRPHATACFSSSFALSLARSFSLLPFLSSFFSPQWTMDGSLQSKNQHKK